MLPSCRPKGLVLLVFLLAPVSGCAFFEAHQHILLYSAHIGQDAEVKVFRETEQNAVLTGPKYNFSRVVLRLTDSQQTPIEAEIVRVHAPLGEPHPLVLGELEGRSSSNGSRVWIVDVDNRRALAAIDRTTREVTCVQDSMPTWAKLDGGTALTP